MRVEFWCVSGAWAGPGGSLRARGRWPPRYHEKALLIANNADSLPLQIKSASRLVHVYRTLAEKCARGERLGGRFECGFCSSSSAQIIDSTPHLKLDLESRGLCMP